MMELSRETVAGVIGAAIAVLLQITVAPAITLFEAVPNFIVAFCIVRAVATPAASGSVMPLVLGLLFDLMGGGPVGALAFVLVLVTFLASRLFMALNNDTLFMPVAIMLACIMLVEVMYGLIVVVCGLGAALILWSLPGVSAVLEPYLVMLNSLPKSALAPILIVWLGSNMRTIIVAAVSVAVFGSIITLHNGFLQTDQEQIKLIYSLGGSKRDVLTKLLLPAAVPLILSNMKVNVGLCLVGVIIGEFLAAQAGLGYLIIYGSQVFQMDMVVMSIILLCIMSAALYQGVGILGKFLQQQYHQH